MCAVARDQDWTFGGTWPFEPRWFESADGAMHYVDEGPRGGSTVVLLHGNPTWSYSWRAFIPALVEAGHRAIAVDHLGFGRSDKPDEPAVYGARRHAERLEALLESLDLHDVTIVPQDWGGPIGLWWAVRHPERVRRYFILNTFTHPPLEPVKLPVPLKVFRAPVTGEITIKGLDLFKRVLLFRLGVVHRERMTPEVKRAYRAPHPNWSSRTAILAFPRQIPKGPQGPVADLCREIEQGLVEHVRDDQIRIVWAQRGVGFGEHPLVYGWLRTHPNADVRRLDDVGHYLQDDAPEQVVPLLLDFLEG